MLAGTHKIALVVGVGAKVGVGHHLVSVVGDFRNETIGRTTSVGALKSVAGGVHVGGIGAAANQQVVFVVGVDGIDGVVAISAQIGAPQKVLHVVVQLEYHTVLLASLVLLERVGCCGKLMENVVEPT